MPESEPKSNLKYFFAIFVDKTHNYFLPSSIAVITFETGIVLTNQQLAVQFQDRLPSVQYAKYNPNQSALIFRPAEEIENDFLTFN